MDSEDIPGLVKAVFGLMLVAIAFFFSLAVLIGVIRLVISLL